MKYVAFLRAVNVGGRYVRMEALKRAFATLAVENVETFIASGNVIFDSRTRGTHGLERRAEAALKGTLGFEVDTFLRSLPELRAVLENAPGAMSAAGEDAVVHVGFLRSGLSPDARAALARLSSAMDTFETTGREIFWLHRRGDAERGLAAPNLEKTLEVRATFRNIRTVRRLLEKYGAFA